MNILIIGGLVGILFLVQLQLYRMWWSKGVEILLQFDEEIVQAGNKTTLSEVVTNNKWLPLAVLKVKFCCSRNLRFQGSADNAVTDLYYRNDLFSIMDNRKITRKHEITCTKRGYYGIYSIDLVGSDLFLTGEMMETWACETHIYVVPKAMNIEDMEPALRKINGEVITRRHLIEDAFTYRGIREYESFDEMKMINWKASAKTGELKVNMRNYTAASAVRILLNLEDNHVLRREELLEMCIEIAAFLVEHFLKQGVRVELFANARDQLSGNILKMESGMDSSYLDSVYQALARLDLSLPTVKFEECFAHELYEEKDSLYYIFISSEKHPEFQEVLKKAGEFHDYTWVCPVKRNETFPIDEAVNPHTCLITERVTKEGE